MSQIAYLNDVCFHLKHDTFTSNIYMYICVCS